MTKHNISRFIKDYLENKLTAKQNAKLETWYLLKAEENKTVDPPIEYEALEDKIWSKIVSEISQPELKSPEVKKLAKVYKGIVSIGIAASLLMIAGVGYLIFNKNTKADDQYVIAKHYDLAPGTDKAVLTLSDGRNIDLGKDSSGKIATEAGVEISKTSDGTLVYKISGKNIPTAGFNMVKTPVGGQYMVILPDGTKVWLNAGSSLKYPTFFAASGREVVLTGEGYFEVAHVEINGNRVPFFVSVIKNQEQVEKVEVLGTHFNINAYTNESRIETTLINGSIKLASKYNHTVLLKPGEMSKLGNGKIEVKQADTEMAIAWKNGAFVFREDLPSVMRKIARWYDVEIVYQQTAPENLMLGGWISRSSNISEVLNHIQLTGKVHFKLEGRRVIVSR